MNLRRKILRAAQARTVSSSNAADYLMTLNSHALSEGQKGLWVTQIAQPKSAALNIPMPLSLSQQCNFNTLKKALGLLLEKHPLLTAAIEVTDAALQLNYDQFQLDELLTEDYQVVAITEYLQQKANIPFDMKQGPLAKIYLCGDESHRYLMIVVHHIIFDGTSLRNLLLDLANLYQALSQQQLTTETVVPPLAGYADYVEQEAQYLSSDAATTDLQRWRELLVDFDPDIDLLLRAPQQENTPSMGSTRVFRCDEALVKQARDFIQRSRVMPSAFYFALYFTVLARFTKKKKLFIAMPTGHGRSDTFAAEIGFYVNVLPIGLDVLQASSFQRRVEDLEQNMIRSLEYGRMPFPVLARELELTKSDTNSMVMQASYNYNNYENVAEEKQFIAANADLLSATKAPHVRQQGQFEIELEVLNSDMGLELSFKYNPKLYSDDAIATIAEAYLDEMRYRVTHSDTMTTPNLVAGAVDVEQIALWNETSQDLGSVCCVHDLFSQQVKIHPNKTAVKFEEKILTYRELDELSDSVALLLQDHGVTADSLVGICVPRSLQMMIYLLGILKAGGAYVPLDSNYPDSRLQYIIDSAQCTLVLSCESELPRISQLVSKDTPLLPVESELTQLRRRDSVRYPERRATPTSLMYVLYTSGSTGKPKGVMLEHAALYNRLRWMQEHYEFNARDIVLQKTPYSFDVSVWELFLPLISGGMLVFAKPNMHKDPKYIADIIVREKITATHFVPSMLNAFLVCRDSAMCTNLKRVVCSGEELPLQYVERFFAKLPSVQLHNLYGPTEAAVDVTYYECQPHDKLIPIGKPISNIQLYILDDAGRQSPVGVPGELCIGGVGLARGYLNRDDLTSDKFRLHHTINEQTIRLYHTGDIARWRRDGNIEYLGRMDNQVKIRGNRIELGEIENVLLAHPAVEAAALRIDKVRNQLKLVALYSCESGVSDTDINAQLEALAKQQLPEYMVPHTYYRVAKIPLNENGKIDRKTLQSIDLKAEMADSIDRTLTNTGSCEDAKLQTSLDLSTITSEIKRIWAKELDCDAVPTNKGFYQLGGDSISAINITEEISEKYSVDFSVTRLFEKPTISDIAQYVVSQQQATMAKNGRAPQHDPFHARARSAAIIGIACQFPRVNSVAQFWDVLAKGEVCSRPLSRDELVAQGAKPSIVDDPEFVYPGFVLNDRELFDNEFFDISPSDAKLMDPQLRILLMETWHALEDARYTPEDIADSAVYMSASNNGYKVLGLTQESQDNGVLANSSEYLSWIFSQSGSLATLISYSLGLNGPSMAVHSNCSSSMAGLSLGLQDIQSGRVQHALVGAASIYPEASRGYVFQEGLNLSRRGKIRAFDRNADGMIPGEGACVLVLKDSEQAERDGDRIYAHIRAVALNNDGSQKAGFYTPSVNGQASVIERSFENAGVTTADITYIESHGTGTKIGDAVELAALQKVFGESQQRDSQCYLGSVKETIGHLDAAAGLAGCVKAALALYYRQVPPSPNFEHPGDDLNALHELFKVNSEGVVINTPSEGAFVGVSSFGIGGSNAHAVLQSAANEQHRDATGESAPRNFLAIFPISAKTVPSLRMQVRQLRDFIAESTPDSVMLADIAYSLQVTRTAFDERIAIVAHTSEELLRQLEEIVNAVTLDAYMQTSEELQAFSVEDIRIRVNTKDLDTVAKYWCGGGTIIWKEIYQESSPQTCDLPLYAFDKKPHWIVDTKTTVTEASVTANDIHIFQETWQRVPLLSRVISKLAKLLFVVDSQRALQKLNKLLDIWSLPDVPVLATFSQELANQNRELIYCGTGKVDSSNTVFGKLTEDSAAVVYLLDLQGEGDSYSFSAVTNFVKCMGNSTAEKQTVLLGLAETPHHRALEKSLIGMARSCQQAYPKLQLRCIFEHSNATAGLDGDAAKSLGADLLTDSSDAVRYCEGHRYTLTIHAPIGLQEQSLISQQPAAWLQENGVYVITGGTGVVCTALAATILKNRTVTLILIGRAPHDAGMMASLRAEVKYGGSVEYLQADITDSQKFADCLAEIRARYTTINGVFHGAGVQSALKLPEKTGDQFAETIKPKHAALGILKHLYPQCVKDFIVLFSSSSAVLGDFGSCDYAVANRLMNEIVEELGNNEVSAPKLLAVSWPQWEIGRYHSVSDEKTRSYLDYTGQKALSIRVGLALIGDLLESHTVAAVMPLLGELSNLRQFVARSITPHAGISEPSKGIPSQTCAEAESAEGYLDALQHNIATLISDITGIERSAITWDAELKALSLDSIKLADLAKALNIYYDLKISPTVFFSYSTIATLSDWLLENYTQAIQAKHLASVPEPASGGDVAPNADITQHTQELRPAAMQQAIAIVGMSARVAGCDTIEQAWQALVSGSSCITDIPEDRYDWRSMYSASGEPGKSNSRWGGFLNDVKAFDPLFFGISPLEAEQMDPRQRILLQESWKALEDANVGAERLQQRSIGMFVGAEQGEYQMLSWGQGGSVTANHDATLAARLPYFLDQTGPAFTINTACSSGLVGLHQACQALRSGECDLALVAGINLLLSPVPYVSNGAAGMLSPDGRCYAFDNRANGLVPGEAVVVLALKRLADARQEGDCVHAVIEASGVNYDGKTNGITAPNGASQVKLLTETYQRFDIDPNTIEYIVAHGTGTRLGDPIEINALSEVFSGAGVEHPVAITSNKPNFGHTFAASGLVNVLNMVQAMQHQALPPSINVDTLNDFVGWEESPFYVSQECRPWLTEQDHRRGAVSAFGVSGTNAHVVLREADAGLPQSVLESAPPYIITLSAKHPEALQQRKLHLRALLTREVIDLATLSYNLGVYRVGFQHRCAFVVTDTAQLLQALQAPAAQSQTLSGKVPDTFRPAKNLEDDLLNRCAALQQVATRTLAQRIADAEVLAQAFCDGYIIPWETLFPQPMPQLRMPVYEFVTKDYWVKPLTTHQPTSNKISPLIHRKIEVPDGHCFVTKLTGDEFFLQDHIVADTPVLPGAAQLEMVLQAATAVRWEDCPLQLEDIVWVRPIVVTGDPVNVAVRIHTTVNGRCRFDIFQYFENDLKTNSKPSENLFSTGFIMDAAQSAPPARQLSDLLKYADPIDFDAAQYYGARSSGIVYGCRMQGLRGLHRIDQEIMATLELPVDVDVQQYLMTPVLLDSAFQATVGFHSENATSVELPFALDRLTFYKPLGGRTWALVTRNGESVASTYSFQLFDESGELCASLDNLTSRAPLATQQPTTGKQIRREESLYTLQAAWQPVVPQPATSDSISNDKMSVTCPKNGLLVFDARDPFVVNTLQSEISTKAAIASNTELQQVILMLPASGSFSTRMEASPSEWASKACLQVLRLVKGLISEGYQTRKIAFSVITTNSIALLNEAPDYWGGGISGLLGALAKECLNWDVLHLDVESEQQWPEVTANLAHFNADTSGDSYVLRDDCWYRESLQACDAAVPHFDNKLLPRSKNLATSFVTGGVYIIVGGAGGVGSVLTGYLLKRYEARVIWLGRREIDVTIREAMTAFNHGSGSLEYIQCDACDAAQLEATKLVLKDQYPTINGVINAAAVFADKSLALMDEARFLQAFESKSNVLVNLTRVFSDTPLDFILNFSSIQSFTKAPGQSNYAAGCTFSDNLFSSLNPSMETPLKTVCWGFWGEVGAVATQEYRDRMAHYGFASLSNAEGMAALESFLKMDEEKLVVVKICNLSNVPLRSLQKANPTRESPQSISPSLDAKRDNRRAPTAADAATDCRALLKAIIAEALKYSSDEIEDDRSFSDYGIDSIVAISLVSALSDKLGVPLKTTVFFDYSSVNRLTDHLLETYPEKWQTKIRETTAPVSETEFDSDSFARDLIKSLLVETLKLDPVSLEDDKSLSDYGVDSLTAVNLVSALNQRLGDNLKTTALFDHNTVNQLANYLVQEYADALHKLATVETTQMATTDDLQRQPAANPMPLGEMMHEETGNFLTAENALTSAGREPLGVVLERPVHLHDMGHQVLPMRALTPTQVCISVRAFSLSFSDLLCVKGMYPNMPAYPFTPGGEASGVIVAVGADVAAFKPGDAVIALPGAAMGAHATMLICDMTKVMPKPERLDFSEAAALPLTAITVIDVFDKAKPQRGESILIQTAAGGVGLIAIQMAQQLGLEIYATAGSQHKLDFLQELGVHHTINYLTEDFETAIKNRSGGRGVDIVLNTLAGDAIQKGLNSLAPGGRYVEIAMTALKSARSVDLSVLTDNQTVFSIDLAKLSAREPQQLEQHTKTMLQMAERGELKPIISERFNFADYHEAYQSMENRGNIGKVVVCIPPEQQFSLATASDLQLRSPEAHGAQTLAVSPIQQPQQLESPAQQPIAIIGISGRFAQSENVQAFWQNIKAGRSLVSKVTRWDLDHFYSQLLAHKEIKGSFCTHGGMLENIDLFDPYFFNISGVEANFMDPQQRLFLETCWQALEDAAYVGDALKSVNCGVYVGCASGDYSKLMNGNTPAQTFWGNSMAVVPSRISYFLDLSGPAVGIDTACSSSLVAIHIANQALWTGEVDMAIAGGVHVQSTPEFFLSSSNGDMLSPSGRCYTFDSRADGFVPGEGSGALVLKRLDDALHARDNIHAVIRASGTNQDGTTNGITAPSGRSQEELLTRIYQRFAVSPDSVQLVEAHGTGTPLGDPIEFNALAKVYGRHYSQKQACALGSIKTNLGHAATAAGVASILKVVMALKDKTLPASLNFDNHNTHIDIANSPFYVNTESRDWPQPQSYEQRRRAAVSSFSFSGTNAHLVVEEAPVLEHASAPVRNEPIFFALSAKSHEALQQLVATFVDYLDANSRTSFENCAYTLLVGRKHFGYRIAGFATALADASSLLKSWLKNNNDSGVLLVAEDQSLSQELREQAEKYLSGKALDRRLIPGKNRARRLSLPGYPLDRDRYWIPDASLNQAIVASSESPQMLPHVARDYEIVSDMRGPSYRITQAAVELCFEPFSHSSALALYAELSIDIALDNFRASRGVPMSATDYLVVSDVYFVRPTVYDKAQVTLDTWFLTESEHSVSFEVTALQQATDDREAPYPVDDIVSQGRITIEAQPQPAYAEFERIAAALRHEHQALHTTHSEVNGYAIAALWRKDHEYLIELQPRAHSPSTTIDWAHLCVEIVRSLSEHLASGQNVQYPQSLFPVSLQNLKQPVHSQFPSFVWLCCRSIGEKRQVDLRFYDAAGKPLCEVNKLLLLTLQRLVASPTILNTEPA